MTDSPRVDYLGRYLRTASMGRRLGAYVIDLIFLLACVIGVQIFLIYGLEIPVAADTPRLYVIIFMVKIVYEPVMTAWRGATFGKTSMSIRVVDKDYGDPITAGPSFGRYFVKEAFFLLNWLAPIMFILWIVWALSPLFDRSGYRQGWHDKMAGTWVVEA